MNQRPYLKLTLGGVFILSVLLIFSARKPTYVDVSQPSQTPSSTRQLTSQEIFTIDAEHTAIAIFTQNPTLALSSTPFYAEIIFNNVLRNLTQIPFPSRPCYLDPTNVPANLATPISECGPFVATIMLSDQPRELMGLMEKAGLTGTVGITSDGLEAINESDNRPFVAVRSHFGFAITVDTVTNQTLLNTSLLTLADIIVNNINSLDYVSTNADIYIEFQGKDGTKLITTTYTDLYQAYENGFSGNDLIQALGGFTDKTNEEH